MADVEPEVEDIEEAEFEVSEEEQLRTVQMRQIATEEARQAVAGLCGLLMASLRQATEDPDYPPSALTKVDALIGGIAEGLNDFGKTQ